MYYLPLSPISWTEASHFESRKLPVSKKPETTGLAETQERRKKIIQKVLRKEKSNAEKELRIRESKV